MARRLDKLSLSFLTARLGRGAMYKGYASSSGKSRNLSQKSCKILFGEV